MIYPNSSRSPIKNKTYSPTHLNLIDNSLKIFKQYFWYDPTNITISLNLAHFQQESWVIPSFKFFTFSTCYRSSLTLLSTCKNIAVSCTSFLAQQQSQILRFLPTYPTTIRKIQSISLSSFVFRIQKCFANPLFAKWRLW